MENGGFAFPVLTGMEEVICNGTKYQKAHFEQPGMTLRDYFAGQFLAGFLFNQDRLPEINSIADFAYQSADAMLAARKREAT